MKITTIDSLRFLKSMIKPGIPSSSGQVFTNAVCSAKLFRTDIKNPKGLIVAFHGLNQMANDDPRMEHLAHCFNKIGYNCLLPKLNAFAQVKLLVDSEVTELVEFFNDLLDSQISTYDYLSFIGPSTSCLYMMKMVTHAQFQSKVRSLCFISPYYDSYMSLQDILETPKDIYAQLVTLKIMLYTENKLQIRRHSSDELEFLNRVVAFSFDLKDEADVLTKILKMVSSEYPENKRLFKLVTNLGNSGFIDEALEPAVLEMAQKMDYSSCLDSFNSKLTIIHGFTDNIYASTNSYMLAENLVKKQISHKFYVTKLLDHAKLVPSQLIKEVCPMINMLNFFLNAR